MKAIALAVVLVATVVLAQARVVDGYNEGSFKTTETDFALNPDGTIRIKSCGHVVTDGGFKLGDCVDIPVTNNGQRNKAQNCMDIGAGNLKVRFKFTTDAGF